MMASTAVAGFALRAFGFLFSSAEACRPGARSPPMMAAVIGTRRQRAPKSSGRQGAGGAKRRALRRCVVFLLGIVLFQLQLIADHCLRFVSHSSG